MMPTYTPVSLAVSSPLDRPETTSDSYARSSTSLCMGSMIRASPGVIEKQVLSKSSVPRRYVHHSRAAPTSLDSGAGSVERSHFSSWILLARSPPLSSIRHASPGVSMFPARCVAIPVAAQAPSASAGIAARGARRRFGVPRLSKRRASLRGEL